MSRIAGLTDINDQHPPWHYTPLGGGKQPQLLLANLTKDTLNNPLIVNPFGGVLSCWPVIYYYNRTWYLYLGGPNVGQDCVLWTSGDGVHFSSQGVVLPRGAGGAWDKDAIEPHGIIRLGDKFLMYYGGLNVRWGTGIAESTDLRTWSKYVGNPVISFAAANVADPTPVLFNNRVYLYWTLMGAGGQRVAVSDDGYSFFMIDRDHPPISEGVTGDWDASQMSAITGALAVGSGLLCIFIGRNAGAINQIGSGYSLDGKTFYKFSGNPVIPVGGVGTWDEKNIAHADIVLLDGILYIYYAGQNAANVWSIGRAYARLW